VKNKGVKIEAVSRRMFLKGSGSSLLAIPFLPSLMPRETWAQSAETTIRRLVMHTSGYGSGHAMHELPTLDQLGLQLSVPSDHKPVRYAKMQDFVKAAGITRILGPGANALANSITIMRGLDFPVDFSSHGYGHTLGNLRANNEGGSFPDTETIDQLLAKNKKFNPKGSGATFIKNLPFFGDNLISFARNTAGQVVGVSPVATDPRALYNRLFNNGNYPESPGGAGQPAIPADPKREPLNRVLASYKSVRNSAQISRADRAALDNYFDLFSSILNGLATGSPGTSVGACLHKGIVIKDDGGNVGSVETLRSFADILTAAIMCDITRVASLAWFFELGHAGVADFHHEVTHPDHLAVVGGIPNHQRIADARGNVVQKFCLRLAQNLSAATDPGNGKPYLYNSLIFSTAEDLIPHTPTGVPMVIFGNAGGNFSSGNYIDYTDRTQGAFRAGGGFFAEFNSKPGDARFSHLYYGQPYNRLLVTVLRAMGLQPSEYEDPTLNTGFQNITNGKFGAHNDGIASLGGYGVLGDPGNAQLAARLKNYQLKYFKDPLPLPPG